MIGFTLTKKRFHKILVKLCGLIKKKLTRLANYEPFDHFKRPPLPFTVHRILGLVGTLA